MTSLTHLRDLVALPKALLPRISRVAVRGARDRVRDLVETALEDPDFELAWQACAQIPGWLDRHAARLLFGLARRGPGEGVIVEIGSYLGRSTIVLALGAMARGHGQDPVVAIDPHEDLLMAEAGDLPVTADTYPLFLRNLQRARVAEVVEPVRATSRNAVADWGRPIRLLYIDGLHDYDSVSADIERWAPHVAPGGLVVFDDYAVGDVRQAIRDGQRSRRLPGGIVSVGEAAVCGFTDVRALRPYLVPRASRREQTSNRGSR